MKTSCISKSWVVFCNAVDAEVNGTGSAAAAGGGESTATDDDDDSEDDDDSTSVTAEDEVGLLILSSV